MPEFSGLRINGVDYNIAGGGGTGSVTGVKGAQESTYRTGNVNLTPANIGALPSTTTLADLSEDATHRTVTDTEKATWNGKADTSDIPTNTSELTNDSGFITGLVVLTYNSSTWQEFLDAFNANKLVLCKVPTTSTRARYAFLAFYNGDEHSAEFQYYRSISTHTDTDQGDEVYVYKLTSYSTWSTTTRKTYSKVNVTSGGGITKTYSNSAVILAIDSAYASFTNYYTKTDVNELIAGITTVSFEIVQALPSTGETNVIYLVPKSTAQTNNTYDEYIYANNAWEKIGDTEIDLSNYYTKTESDARYLQSFTETDPTVPAWAKASTKPTYTKSEVGLGNVPNVSTNDQTPTFTQASSRTNIASGEKLSVILGKIMKWFADLKNVAFTGSYSDLSNKPTATTDNVGSASLGTAISADDITAWSAGTTPTLGTAISADDITAWDAGSVPTLGTAISADDITAWSAGSAATATASGGVVTFTNGSVPSLSYTARSIPNVTSVGTKPSLSYTAKSIPNVTNVGTLPSLSYTARSIPNVTVTSKTVVTGLTE